MSKSEILSPSYLNLTGVPLTSPLIATPVISGLRLNLTTHATTTAIATTDDYIVVDTSGGAFADTFPAASAGKWVLGFKKKTSDFSVYTLNRAGSDTIVDNTTALTSTTLDTQGEEIEARSDGTSVIYISRRIPSVWASYTPTITGGGTATSIEVQWRRVGDSAEIQGKFTTGTATAVEARFSLPSGLTSSDTTKIPSIRIAGIYDFNSVGAGVPNIGVALIEPSVTYLTFGYRTVAVTPLSKQNGDVGWGSTTTIPLFATVPISGWKG